MVIIRDEQLQSESRSHRERVLVLAPTGGDAAVVLRILEDEGRDVDAVDSLGALAREVVAGAGVAVIASEALLDRDACAGLRMILEQQEPWSDIPILLLSGSSEAEKIRTNEVLGASAQVVILERPLGIATFLTAIDAALRSRRRQYEVKRLMIELGASAAAIRHAHEEADRVKDEFLATLAHELRSPMTAILGWIQMLKMGDLNPVEAADALRMIESSTKVQSHIIEDLMDVSRILAGKIMIEPALIDFSQVVANVVATFRPSASLQGIDLGGEGVTKPVFVWGDDARLQQVGWNLVSNAIKFTDKGGSVRVVLSIENEWAVMRVIDTGKGISPELLPHVFERYRQGEGSPLKPQRGLGLGLAIVAHLVESHGGTIAALSAGAGKGSEFVVKLPLRKAGDAQA